MNLLVTSCLGDQHVRQDANLSNNENSFELCEPLRDFVPLWLSVFNKNYLATAMERNSRMTTTLI